MQSTLTHWFNNPQYADIELHSCMVIHAHRCVLALSDSKFILRYLKNEKIYLYGYSVATLDHCIGWFYGIEMPTLTWHEWVDCVQFAKALQSESLIAHLDAMKISSPAEEIAENVSRGAKTVDTTDLRQDIVTRGFEAAVHPFIDTTPGSMSGRLYDQVFDAMITDHIVCIAILCARTHTHKSTGCFNERFEKFIDQKFDVSTLAIISRLPRLREMPMMKMISKSFAVDMLLPNHVQRILEWANAQK